MIKLMAQTDDLVYGLIISEVYKGVMHQLETQADHLRMWMDFGCSYDPDEEGCYLNHSDYSHYGNSLPYIDAFSKAIRGYNKVELNRDFKWLCKRVKWARELGVTPYQDVPNSPPTQNSTLK